MLWAGLGRVRSRDRRRSIVQILLAAVVVGSLVETSLLVASLVSAGLGIGGPQLLHSTTTVWLSNVIAFGLAYWGLGCGGPVRRALSAESRAPDVPFPQDENPGSPSPDGPRTWGTTSICR